MVKRCYKTSFLQQLERRAKAISGEFNSQNVAITLLVFATCCDHRDKAGEPVDGAAGAAGGGDIRGVELAGC
jgi:hypothetical protein